jgi:hypothetical protein
MFSCGGKKKNIPDIKVLKEYKDPILGFGFKYPDNWYTLKSEGVNFACISSQEAANRFETLDEGPTGVKVIISAIQLKEGLTFDSLVKMQKYQVPYSQPQTVKLDGVDCIKKSYSFDLSDGKFEGEIIYGMKDPKVATIITIESFGGIFKDYQKNFDEILSTVKLAQMQQMKVDTVKKIEEQPLPSQNLAEVKGENLFSIKIPDNFDSKRIKVPNSLLAYLYSGTRRADSDINIVIFDASKQKNLDKIANDNKALMGNSNPTATSIAGQKAYVFEYSPRAKVRSRVWFVIKNDKLFRITMDWSTDEEQAYKPILEKSIGTFNFQ